MLRSSEYKYDYRNVAAAVAILDV